MARPLHTSAVAMTLAPLCTDGCDQLQEMRLTLRRELQLLIEEGHNLRSTSHDFDAVASYQRKLDAISTKILAYLHWKIASLLSGEKNSAYAVTIHITDFEARDLSVGSENCHQSGVKAERLI